MGEYDYASVASLSLSLRIKAHAVVAHVDSKRRISREIVDAY